MNIISKLIVVQRCLKQAFPLRSEANERVVGADLSAHLWRAKARPTLDFFIKASTTAHNLQPMSHNQNWSQAGLTPWKLCQQPGSREALSLFR